MLLALVIALFTFEIGFAQSGHLKQDKAYKFRQLQNCDKDSACVAYLTDTSSLITLFRFHKSWVKLVYPLSELVVDGEKYNFAVDLTALNNSRIRDVTFIPETIKGYEITNGKRKYLLLYGGMLGSTGISGAYSFVIVFNLNSKVKDKHKAYGCIAKEFSITHIKDFTKDGILDIKVDNRIIPLN